MAKQKCHMCINGMVQDAASDTYTLCTNCGGTGEVCKLCKGTGVVVIFMLQGPNQYLPCDCNKDAQ